MLTRASLCVAFSFRELKRQRKELLAPERQNFELKLISRVCCDATVPCLNWLRFLMLGFWLLDCTWGNFLFQLCCVIILFICKGGISSSISWSFFFFSTYLFPQFFFLSQKNPVTYKKFREIHAAMSTSTYLSFTSSLQFISTDIIVIVPWLEYQWTGLLFLCCSSNMKSFQVGVQYIGNLWNASHDVWTKVLTTLPFALQLYNKNNIFSGIPQL